ALQHDPGRDRLVRLGDHGERLIKRVRAPNGSLHSRGRVSRVQRTDFPTRTQCRGCRPPLQPLRRAGGLILLVGKPGDLVRTVPRRNGRLRHDHGVESRIPERLRGSRAVMRRVAMSTPARERAVATELRVNYCSMRPTTLLPSRLTRTAMDFDLSSGVEILERTPHALR